MPARFFTRSALLEIPDQVESHARGVHTRAKPVTAKFIRSGRSLRSDP
jgi:hypothetical protein